MHNDWDASGNGPLSQGELEAEWDRRRTSYSDRMAQRYGIVDVPHMSEHIVRSNFPFWADDGIGIYSGVIAPYHANKALWLCHNCGSYGWKQGDIRELFKCYSCRSRNVTICRSGELSLAIRNSGIGVNMTTIYDQRRLRLREARRARRTARTT